MTSTTSTARSDRALRTVFLVDTATCLATGTLLTVAPATVADVLDTDAGTGLIRGAGIALLAYVPLLVVLAGSAGRTLRTGAMATAAGDGAWVGGSVLLVVAGASGGLGDALVLAAAAVVGAIGSAKLVNVRAASVPTPPVTNLAAGAG
ncbi:MAG TPA: hypothetical protein VM345_19320 [Acidimicrobiales bacterium]|nr:hypothetical protein [Acidimicrobiales bacterium]